MAENVKEATSQPNAGGHNAVALDEQIRNAVQAVVDKEFQIKDIVAKETGDLKADIKAIKKDLAKHDIDWKNLGWLHAALKRQTEIKRMEDETDRNAALDAMRIGYDALDKGGQLDFVKALSSQSNVTPITDLASKKKD